MALMFTHFPDELVAVAIAAEHTNAFDNYCDAAATSVDIEASLFALSMIDKPISAAYKRVKDATKNACAAVWSTVTGKTAARAKEEMATAIKQAPTTESPTSTAQVAAINQGAAFSPPATAHNEPSLGASPAAQITATAEEHAGQSETAAGHTTATDAKVMATEQSDAVGQTSTDGQALATPVAIPEYVAAINEHTCRTLAIDESSNSPATTAFAKLATIGERPDQETEVDYPSGYGLDTDDDSSEKSDEPATLFSRANTCSSSRASSLLVSEDDAGFLRSLKASDWCEASVFDDTEDSEGGCHVQEESVGSAIVAAAEGAPSPSSSFEEGENMEQPGVGGEAYDDEQPFDGSFLYSELPDDQGWRLPACSWPIFGQPLSACAEDAPLLVVTNPEGGIGYPEEPWFFCRSGEDCLCAAGWYCHLYDETEDQNARTRSSGSRLQRCTWYLFDMPPSQHPNVPRLQVTTPEGDVRFPNDIAYYPSSGSWADDDDDEEWA